MADDLKKIKDLVEIVVNKIRGVETQQSIMADQFRIVRDQQSVMNDKLDSVEDKLDNHTASLVKIEDTLEGYADMYNVNKEKSDELEERVETIEEKLAISDKN